MRLDTHVHTSPGSRCSRMTVLEYLEELAQLDVTVACITNHGDMSDYYRMEELAPAGLLVIPGVEISSLEGDFLIFSTNYDYLSSLIPAQPLPPREERPTETAVVWAHPFAGIPHGRAMSGGHIESVASRVDGIEVYNGNWPDEAASDRAGQIAADYGLAELGGSDAHRRQDLFRCWTEIPDGEGNDLAGFILRKGTFAGR